jgi:serine protease Do
LILDQHAPRTARSTSRRRAWLAASLAVLALGGCAHARATPSPQSGAAIAVTSRVGGDTGPTAGIEELERAFERAAEVIAPSVVSITSERDRPAGDELPAFLRPFGSPDGVLRGLGSGVIVDARKGYILTNNHVVEDAARLRVRLNDDREFDAEVVGTDPKTDVAVIKIDADGLVPAITADSDKLRVGQWVMAAGSPFGLSKSVTAGIVSATGRGGMGITDYGDFIQTDAAINQGNSGGPLIDLHGRVIGINTAIASPTGGSNGVGFAIPIDLVKVVMKQLIDHGSVQRGWLGIVMGRKMTPELAKSFGWTGTDGVLVDDVAPDGPGAAAGLKPGDIVVDLDGKRVRGTDTLRNGIAQRRPGTKMKLGVFRDGSQRTVQVELAAHPDEATRKPTRHRGDSSKKPEKKPKTLGLELADPPRGAKVPGVLVARVMSDGLADGWLEPGDMLLEVGGKKVDSAAQARRLLEKADLDGGVRLRIQRDGFGHYMVIRRQR